MLVHDLIVILQFMLELHQYSSAFDLIFVQFDYILRLGQNR